MSENRSKSIEIKVIKIIVANKVQKKLHFPNNQRLSLIKKRKKNAMCIPWNKEYN